MPGVSPVLRAISMVSWTLPDQAYPLSAGVVVASWGAGPAQALHRTLQSPLHRARLARSFNTNQMLHWNSQNSRVPPLKGISPRTMPGGELRRIPTLNLLISHSLRRWCPVGRNAQDHGLSLLHRRNRKTISISNKKSPSLYRKRSCSNVDAGGYAKYTQMQFGMHSACSTPSSRSRDHRPLSYASHSPSCISTCVSIILNGSFAFVPLPRRNSDVRVIIDYGNGYAA